VNALPLGYNGLINILIEPVFVITDKSNLTEVGAAKLNRGAFAERLGKSNFIIPEEVRQELPEIWTSLRFDKEDRKSIMDKYKMPDNYVMEVADSDNKNVSGAFRNLDLAYKKAELYSRDVLLIDMALLTELGKENPDFDMVYDMAMESTIMTMHQAGSIHEDRKTNVRRSLGANGKPIFGDNIITGEVDVKALLQEKQIEAVRYQDKFRY